MRDKLLKDAIIKAPHEYFGVTEEEFCNTLNILIKNKYKGHEQFLTEVLQLKPDGYSISINGSYYHVYSDFGVSFKDLAPKEAAEYTNYATKTESLYAKRKEIFDKFQECLDVALRSCTSTDGLYKRFPILKDTLDKCFEDVNEEIANASD